jgi:hypothetical protein
LWQLNEYQVKCKSEAENISASEESDEESPREERSSQPPEESGRENEEDNESAASGNSDQESRAENARKLAARAALLGSRTGSTKGRRTTTSKAKDTSVGARRVGSASKARQGPGMQGRIMDALRKSASSNTVDTSEQKPSEDDNTDSSSTKASITSNNFTPTSTSKKLTSSSIHSAVSELMQQQMKRRMDEYSSYRPYAQQQHQQQQRKKWSQDDYAKFFGWQRQPPEAGKILIPPTAEPRGDAKLQFPGCLTLRVATSKEDTEIANLRLSVFSNFAPEVRKQLVSRSVRSVISRRVQGATCIVATVPPSIQARKRNKAPVILGSAECSFHEFDDTCLGRRRLPQSILYVTEVAVNPSARRRGIGAKLLEVSRDGYGCFLLGVGARVRFRYFEVMLLTTLALSSPLCEGCGCPRQCARHRDVVLARGRGKYSRAFHV